MDDSSLIGYVKIAKDLPASLFSMALFNCSKILEYSVGVLKCLFRPILVRV